MKQFISAGQWVEKTRDGVRYYNGVHRGFARTMQEALLACQARYDHARGIKNRTPGTHVYSVSYDEE